MLVMVKPDAVMDGRGQEIRSFLISCGMSITGERMAWLTPEMLKALYQCHIDEEPFRKMVKLYEESFAVVIVFEGENAIDVGQKAKKLFREKYNYGYYGSTIHAADNAEEVVRETILLLES
jgi:nucleoside diphosphate kinase